MTCSEFLAMLDDLIDNEVNTNMRADLEEHLRGCEHCEVTLNTTRKTIDVYRHSQPYEFPEELSNRLRSAIMARCNASREGAEAKAKLHAELIRDASSRSS